MSVKPEYYKVLWHNCHKCRTHYTSEQPHVRAYLCDECWNSMPHYRTINKPKVVEATIKHQQRVYKGPTHTNVRKVEERWKELSDMDWPFEYILLYILGCSLCLLTIAYYLWFK